ncbi:anthranilate synthase component I [Paenibacillus sp. J2TS4]|uniref:anthranilate synthase component I n=1 Tax=Paenibacillus sp. J2TS4 TaxID=2807194 RepID=UPI001B10B373|nr:anthranilate synthase component I [Paenibacillus sp. J2TS4]GIP32972.1 anthranilate synthase component I [Paenibacillus sp. J2TS4]
MSILSSFIPEHKKMYTTQGNIEVSRHLQPLDVATAHQVILREIDYAKGALFSSGYEYPGRYSRWDIGFINPALELKANGNRFRIAAENARGGVLLHAIFLALQQIPDIEHVIYADNEISGNIRSSDKLFAEEHRTKQPSIFSVLRAIQQLFYSPEDSFIGLYGAFGYDLVFQFEPMELKHRRNPDDSDVILYFPDEIILVDHHMNAAYQLSYEFSANGDRTNGLDRNGKRVQPKFQGPVPADGYTAGKYAGLVREAAKSFKVGDLFEVVPSHTLYESCPSLPSDVFRRLQEINPSPYGFIINLGSEYLVGSSPEMYVRVEGRRVETCPISGTIQRGINAIEDSDQIKKLLNSAKDESELTMCTDVDRNDKSRICEPGSVQVIGRRQIEMYSHLIHTVDHVEGFLRPEFDALDAFMTHMWAVTITGAPKRAAIRWIEDHEASSRGWYGGAVGYFAFNGDLNTGLTLRTIRIQDGVAQIRVGATLLLDSVPEDEEQETLTKAAALVQAVRESHPQRKDNNIKPASSTVGQGKKILVVDHEDSFVHTLSNYIKQTGADVVTLRAPHARTVLQQESFDLVVLSPGPGRPSKFKLSETIDLCLEKQTPVFGVCLGLQGMVEYFGGSLELLDYPQHGKSSLIKSIGKSPLWEGLPEQFHVGRYHSLYVKELPDCFDVHAISEDGIIMGIGHQSLPMAAVQFHPESIATLRGDVGWRLIENVICRLRTAFDACSNV